jgi:hypothetical protein
VRIIGIRTISVATAAVPFAEVLHYVSAASGPMMINGGQLLQRSSADFKQDGLGIDFRHE